MKNISLIIILFVFAFELNAQNLGAIRGFVKDKDSGEIISYANVALLETHRGTSTDANGYYYIPSIKEGEYEIIFSFMGYKSEKISIVIKQGSITELDVVLEKSAIEFDELSVIGEEISRHNETDLGLQNITAKEIEYLPAAGEADIFKVLQTSPGVSMTGDVTSKYYVRGGAGDQNEVLLNGVPIYNPFHALGIFSVIDPEMISSMEFYKGGFEPDYGGRLSSVLNVVTKDGNKNKIGFTGQASMMAARVAVEGPIPHGSFLVTGRKSYYTSMYDKYLTNSHAPVDFYDLSLKATYENPKLDKGGKFTVHGFASGDKVNNNDQLKEDYSVKNILGGIIWRKVWSSPLFSEFNISYSQFDAEVIPNLSKAIPRKNKLKDFNARFDFTYIYDSKDELGFGLQSKILSTRLQMRNPAGIDIDFNKSGWDLNFFFNYKFYRWENVGLDIGVRGKLLGLADKRPFLFEPRIAFTYLPNSLIAFKIAFGRYSQEIVTLSDENEIISIFEPWIIIPDNLHAPEANHLILGIKTFITERLSFETEGYYKSMSNLVDINEEKYTSDFYDYRNVEGESYGVDNLFKYESQTYYLKASYSLSWAYKIYEGRKYYPRYDRRHSVNLLATIKIPGDWIFSTTWSFASGMPFTQIAGFYDKLINDNEPIWSFSNQYVPSTLWDERNTGRLPNYHRLDMSLSKKIHLPFFDLTLGASVINVYDRENIYYYDRDTGERVNMLPIMPSIFAKVKI